MMKVFQCFLKIQCGMTNRILFIVDGKERIMARVARRCESFCKRLW